MSGSRRISELTSAVAISGDDLMVIVQGGETKQAEVTLLRTLAPVIAVNGQTGSVLLTAANLPGLESLVVNGAVSAAVASVSVRVDNLETDVAAVSVRVDEVSAAVTSVQDYLLAQISIATGGGLADAPNDGSVYGRQDASWVVVPVTALQDSITSVAAVASAALNIEVSGSTTNVIYVRKNSDWIPLTFPYDLVLACSDETTAITTGTALEFSFPRTMSISNLVFEANVGPTSTTCAFEVRVSGSALHSGSILMDPGESTSRTAATTTSLTKTSITAWRRGFVSIGSTDATLVGLKLYLIGQTS